MYTEDDLLPLSGLQHLVFCERQWALIHLEQLWAENRLTAEGRVQHERVHGEEVETRGDTRIVRALRVHSLALGVAGICDVVEFRKVAPGGGAQDLGPGVRVGDGLDLWMPKPVEHKRGKPKPDRCDEVQVCAQAICLEEMLGVQIATGSIFYGLPRRRTDVMFDDDLRWETQRQAARQHELFRLGRTPTAVYEKKCRSCSLVEVCKPKATGSAARSRRYLDHQLEELGIVIVRKEGGKS